jgi:hypothetical protein
VEGKHLQGREGGKKKKIYGNECLFSHFLNDLLALILMVMDGHR